jgi:X-domain of DnaJ-containing
LQAKKAGDKDDPETQLFEKKMREEAEDLKLESFGVELLHAIGSIYLTKSTTWIKTHKNNFLGLPGFLSKMKERGSMVKEGWNLLGSAVNAQMSMEDMAKRQEKGDLDEEALKELEMEMSGKMLLVTWRGTKWEVSNVLRKVCDRVLNDKRVKDQKVLLNRAKAIAFLGAIYKQVKPDENDDERRELEKLVANASKKKEKHRKKEKADKAAAAAGSAGSTPATAA